SVRWNGGTSWPDEAGHPCLGCSEANFWDKNTPFYRHLENVEGYGVHADIDTVGVAATGLLTAGLAVHGIVAAVRRHKGDEEQS
ncbi:MAG TPA: uptake hydrogenase small subunit, partial [Thermoanaerobaculia bacterium]|nr:uptake hydrogenase small subunit [Thermoanaerobaculia bacterium]